MTLFATVDPRPIHFMGIAGAGMSGLALLARQQGAAITGCDNDPSGAADLAALGVEIWRGGNARLGGRDLYVVEADEFDRAFLALAPTVAVVNNVEADHLECYGGSTRALEQAFVEFASRARRVIAGADDAGALRVAAAVSVPVWRVGLAADADVRIVAPELRERGSSAQLALPGGRAVRVSLQVPGLHNLRNAAAALAVALELEADLERCVTALGRFTGVARRFARVGVARGAARAGATTVAVRDRAALVERVAERVRPGDVVFTLGAGDVTRVGPELLQQLQQGDAGRGNER